MGRFDGNGAPVWVYGAGGHGKVVADLLLAANWHVRGFVDDDKKTPTTCLGLPVHQHLTHVVKGDDMVALAIGDNQLRCALAARCLAFGLQLATAVHPCANVANSAALAMGVVVMASAVINAEANVAQGAIINSGSVIEHDCVVEEFAHVSPNASMGGAARLGRLAHLGMGSIILPKRHVHERCVIGAGAVVTKDIAAATTAVGIPARVIGRPS